MIRSQEIHFTNTKLYLHVEPKQCCMVFLVGSSVGYGVDIIYNAMKSMKCDILL